MSLKELASNESDSELSDTQTPSTCPVLNSQEVQDPKQAWGKLYPTIIRLKTIELSKRQFLLGRSTDCDVSLTSENFNPNCLKTVSKTHFLITHDENANAYITDLSKNGTFINENVIGRGKSLILQNDDQIAVGSKKIRVYLYKSIGRTEDRYLPLELRREYEISKKLGEGGCGEVRLLFKKSNCQEYAVKRILKSRTTNALLNSEVRIQNEIAIMKSLFHPNILSVIHTVETEEAVFLVMEYMTGGSLEEQIKLYGKLPEKTVKLIFYQIVLAIQHLHLKGITHRDLKPENILLKTSDNETLIKVADFGISKAIVNSTLMTTRCGTPTFSAPEVIDDNYEKYSQQVDIWSLGVILFYLLSGKLPFKSNSLHNLFKLILSGEYTMDGSDWNLISNDAKNLVKRMLVVSPGNRIKISDILIHPWISNDNSLKRTVERLIKTYANENVDNDDDLPPVKRARVD